MVKNDQFDRSYCEKQDSEGLNFVSPEPMKNYAGVDHKIEKKI